MGKKPKILSLSAFLYLIFLPTTLLAQNHTVPGEVLVKLRWQEKAADFKSLRQRWEKNTQLKILQITQVSPGSGVLLLTFSPKVSLPPALQKLKAMPEVELVEPNYRYELIRPLKSKEKTSELKGSKKNFTNDPMFEKLWGLQNTGKNSEDGKGVKGADIAAIEAWEITKGSRQIKVAIIDTGINYNHEDLKDNIWVNLAEKNGVPGIDDDANGYVDDVHGYNFSVAPYTPDPMDDHGHGSHCSGTIGAIHNNSLGVAGVMAHVQMVAVKFLDARGWGTLSNAIAAVDYATAIKVDIMSNSWGGTENSSLLQEAIQRASDQGIIFVAAAGNNSSNTDLNPHYPSNYPVANIIAVAAHNNEDQLSDFSNFGKNSVHVVGPGEDILSTVITGYATFSGTSMATPHVSGALGLLLASEGHMPIAELKERLVASSVPIRSYRNRAQGGGRLNAYNLLKDIRPERTGPKPEEWRSMLLETPFESPHPYSANYKLQKTIRVPGAKYLRLHIKEYELEDRYDFVIIKDDKGEVLEKISGHGENYESDYVEGEVLKLEMTSDYSVQKWGVLIEKIDFIKE